MLDSGEVSDWRWMLFMWSGLGGFIEEGVVEWRFKC